MDNGQFVENDVFFVGLGGKGVVYSVMVDDLDLDFDDEGDGDLVQL